MTGPAPTMVHTAPSVVDRLGRPVPLWIWLAIGVVVLLLAQSADRLELHRFLTELGGPTIAGDLSPRENSARADVFPPALAIRTPIDGVSGFDPDDLPLFSRIETETIAASTINPATLEVETYTEERQVLVQPIGYLVNVLGQMVSTIELALWATIFALVFSIPLALWGAMNTAPARWLPAVIRPIVAFLRAVPELVSALIFVLVFGFGPLAGIAALGVHSAGFLAKFFAEEMENAPRQAQDALVGFGLDRLTVFRLAILPEVLPAFTALTLYVLDRNVRMATVVGLVGAGGIGQELKGRYDLFQFDHVLTVVIVIFISVVIIDGLCAAAKKRLMRSG